MIVAVKGEPTATVMVYLVFAARVALVPATTTMSLPLLVAVLTAHWLPAAVPGKLRRREESRPP